MGQVSVAAVVVVAAVDLDAAVVVVAAHVAAVSAHRNHGELNDFPAK